MILRRFMQHIKDQNWFAVGLDIIVVIVGIFLGMQVTEWNEDRVNQNRENEILQEILSDVKADLSSYQITVESSLDRLAAYKFIFANVSQDAAVSRVDISNANMVLSEDAQFREIIANSEELKEKGYEQRLSDITGQLWSAAIIVPNVIVSTSALDSLFTSGEIKIISDKSLLTLIQEYRAYSTEVIKVQEVTFRPVRNSAIDVGHKYGLSAFGTVKDEDFLALLEQQPELMATIQTNHSWVQGHFTMISTARKMALEVEATIEAAIQEHND